MFPVSERLAGWAQPPVQRALRTALWGSAFALTTLVGNVASAADPPPLASSAQPVFTSASTAPTGAPSATVPPAETAPSAKPPPAYTLPDYSAAPSKSNVRLALAVGTLAVLIPGVVGGIRTGIAADNGQRSAGLLVASGGFALGPLVSHMITREWGRAALFSAFPAAMTIAATTLVSQVPEAIYGGDAGTRTSFGILFGLGLIGAVSGLLDTAMARDRAADRAKSPPHAYFFAPNVNGTGATLSFGGTL